MSRATRFALFLFVLVSAWRVSVPAQTPEVPLVFIHGFLSSSATWQDAANRFGPVLHADVRRPELQWKQPYPNQAFALQEQLSALPSTVVAVGHSNGGIVAREWSRIRPVHGIVTVGTPHGGAPGVTNGAIFGFRVLTAISRMVSGIIAIGDLAYVYPDEGFWPFVQSALDPGAYLEYIIREALEIFVKQLGNRAFNEIPVLTNMMPDSFYLQGQVTGLNSATNLAREAGNVPARIGITSSTPLPGMPFALEVDRTTALGITASIHYFAVVLMNIANDIQNVGNFEVPKAGLAAESLLEGAFDIFYIEALWCNAISFPYGHPAYGMCTVNDGIVPVWSQQYPGGMNIGPGENPFTFSGPVHTKETEEMLDWVDDALVNKIHIICES